MFVNLRADFGAAGDWSNDTQAFVDAFAHCSTTGQTLVIPPPEPGKHYRIEATTIAPTAPFNVIGSGPNQTRIWAEGFSTGQPVFDFDYSGAVREYAEIGGFTVFSGTGPDPWATDHAALAIRVGDASYMNFRDIRGYGVRDVILFTGNRNFSNTTYRLVGYDVGRNTIRYESFRGGGHHHHHMPTLHGQQGLFFDTDSQINNLVIDQPNAETCSGTSGTFEGAVAGLELRSPREEAGQGAYSWVFQPGTDPRLSPGDPNKRHVQGGILITAPFDHPNNSYLRPFYFGNPDPAQGVVRGVVILAPRTTAGTPDRYAHIEGNCYDVVIMGSAIGGGATPPELWNSAPPNAFARTNRAAYGILADVG
ncbi:MAG: hypothetical protein JJ864_08470 [Rhizobiaceae bacterium]|nr:hypothetical protein [Rhizobiaceae bacterium]